MLQHDCSVREEGKRVTEENAIELVTEEKRTGTKQIKLVSMKMETHIRAEYNREGQTYAFLHDLLHLFITWVLSQNRPKYFPPCLKQSNQIFHSSIYGHLYIHRLTSLDPITIIFMFSMNKPSQSTLLNHQGD